MAATNHRASNRICIITPVHWTHGIGGIEYQVKMLVESLSRIKGIQVSYLSRKLDTQYKPKHYKLYKIPQLPLAQRIGFFMDAAMLLRYLMRLRPDVIYENGGCAYTGIAAYYAKKFGCKMIWHIASDNDLSLQARWNGFRPNKMLDKKILKWGIRNSNVIIAQSQSQIKQLPKFNNHSPVHLIRNFHPMPPIEESFAEKMDQIIWVANLKKLKQPELFLELSERLEKRGIETQCLMVGGPAAGPKGYQEQLEKKFRRLKNLRYMGRLPVNQTNRLIAKSKLLLNTSKWEGFPNTFIQSWMRKTPVISLKVDPDDIITRFNCGIVSGTIDKMVEDIISLLYNDKLRERMGDNAYNFATQNHSMDNLMRIESIILGLE